MMFLPNQARLKALYDMGQVSSQADSMTPAEEATGIDADHSLLVSEKVNDRKKRKSGGTVAQQEELQINKKGRPMAAAKSLEG